MYKGSEMFVSSTGDPQNYSVFSSSNVLWFSVVLEIFSKVLTMHCPKCIFHMNFIDLVGNVMVVKTVSRWNNASENICKKKLSFFGS